MSFEKKGAMYYIRTAGVLTAIGVVSAGLITSLNLLTGPVIAEHEAAAQAAAYKVLFPTLTNVSESTAMEGSYVKSYLTAYKDSDELGKIVVAEGQNSRASYNLLVGISGDSDSPVPENVAIVKQEMTPGYDTTFKKYYDAFIASDCSDDALNAYAGTGATLSCQLFHDMVKEAKDLYAGISGGVAEDWDLEISTIYGTTYTYNDGEDRSVSDGTYLKKYYPLYDDVGNLNEAARIYSLRYSGDDGKIGLAVGISGDSVVSEKAYVLQNTVDESVVGEVATADFSGTFTAMLDEAKAHYAANALETLAVKSVDLFSAAASNSDPTAIENVSITTSATIADGSNSIECENTGTGELVEHWTVYDSSSAELGEVYLCHMSVSFNNPNYYLEAHGEATYMVAFSYESETVVFGKMKVLSDTMSRGVEWEDGYVTAYNKNPGNDIDLSDKKITASATISASASNQLTLKAAEHYSSLKKGA